MSDELHNLADIDHRLEEAVLHLRCQQNLVAALDSNSREWDVSLSLLSNMLRQLGVLEARRRDLIKCVAKV